MYDRTRLDLLRKHVLTRHLTTAALTSQSRSRKRPDSNPVFTRNRQRDTAARCWSCTVSPVHLRLDSFKMTKWPRLARGQPAVPQFRRQLNLGGAPRNPNRGFRKGPTMEKLSLTALARHHLETARQESSGRSAHTVYGGHEHILRQTVMAFTAGRR